MAPTTRILLLGSLLIGALVPTVVSQDGFRFTRDKARQGDLSAAFRAAQMLLKGTDGARKDAAAAARWFRRCADAADPRAQTQLGYMYLKGMGVEHDPAQGARWLLRAAAAGNAIAQFDLGQLYLSGEGVHADIAEAIRWFARAAQNGNAMAQYQLGVLYGQGRPGLAPDTKRALDLIERAANAHYICAEHALGVLFQAGLGPGAAAADKWLERASHHHDQDGRPVDVNRSCGLGPDGASPDHDLVSYGSADSN